MLVHDEVYYYHDTSLPDAATARELRDVPLGRRHNPKRERDEALAAAVAVRVVVHGHDAPKRGAQGTDLGGERRESWRALLLLHETESRGGAAAEVHLA